MLSAGSMLSICACRKTFLLGWLGGFGFDFGFPWVWLSLSLWQFRDDSFFAADVATVAALDDVVVFVFDVVFAGY